MKADLRPNKKSKIKTPNQKWRVIGLAIFIVLALIVLGMMNTPHLWVGGI